MGSFGLFCRNNVFCRAGDYIYRIGVCFGDVRDSEVGEVGRRLASQLPQFNLSLIKF